MAPYKETDSGMQYDLKQKQVVQQKHRSNRRLQNTNPQADSSPLQGKTILVSDYNVLSSQLCT